MAMVIPNEAELNWLKLACNTLGASSWNISLYKTDITLDEDTTLADLEAEACDFSGYSHHSGYYWGTPIADGTSGKAKATSTSNVQFSHSGDVVANDVFGYWIEFHNSGTYYLLGCERFADAPRVMMTLGDLFTVTPCITFSQEV